MNHEAYTNNKQPHAQPLQPEFVSSTKSNDNNDVSTESKKADSPRLDDPLAKLDEAIGFLRTLNLNHSMKKQHERKLLPEEVKQEDYCPMSL